MEDDRGLPAAIDHALPFDRRVGRLRHGGKEAGEIFVYVAELLPLRRRFFRRSKAAVPLVAWLIEFDEPFGSNGYTDSAGDVGFGGAADIIEQVAQWQAGQHEDGGRLFEVEWLGQKESDEARERQGWTW